MLPFFRLGPFVAPVGPLIALAAFYLALEVGDRAARRLKLFKDLVSTVGFLTLLVGLGAGRLAYIVENWSSYQLDWSQILAFNSGTLDPNTGVLVGLGAAYLYLQWRNINWLLLGDAIAPSLALGMAVLSLGNLLTGDAYGAVARDLPWAIFLWEAPRHPVQAYEFLVYLALFGFLWFRASRWELAVGSQFLMSTMLLAGARVFLEPFRGDSVGWAAGLRSAQVTALLVMTGAAWLLFRRHDRPRQTQAVESG